MGTVVIRYGMIRQPRKVSTRFKELAKLSIIVIWESHAKSASMEMATAVS